ncbi:T9SS type A sorting domain-containing protein [Flavobacterium amnicola]|uniref:T9SS type A sorting domain-containing protein n=1 Tax=Flavobacterium amnicola TaxID=2506422 RepID=A0A4Q1K1T3_9FLAO|nr:T9SS type A sorting domain-containing protein [Flavobacterium amnicola]RXR17729.1 T9SS type A sorting domain-containing protein [Flavobacterium amnicola]
MSKKLLLVLFIFISVKSISQTFSNGRIEYGNGSSNMFSTTAIGADGKFYCLFNDGVFTHSSNSINPVYRLLRWESGTSSWVSVANFDASIIPGVLISSTNTMFSDGVSLEIDSTGAYHMLFSVYTSNGLEIKYVYSNNGTSWTYTTIDQTNNATNYGYAHVQLKLDSSNRPHVYYLIRNIGSGGVSSRVYTIMHKNFNGSSWASETVYSQTGGSGTGANELNMIAASIDNNNKSYVAFVAETNGSGTDGSLLYTNNVSGSWSAPVFLATGATGSAAADRVTILSDSNNKQHIIYRENNTTLKLIYTTNKTGSWVGGQMNGNIVAGINSSTDGFHAFTRNASNDLFLAYNASPTTTNIGQVNYACLFNGATTWQTGTVFTGNSRTGQFISAEFSNSKNAMITFDHFTDPAATGGNPSYGPPNNPRQVQYATTIVNNLSIGEWNVSKFNIYPNPTNSVLNIEFAIANTITVEVIDLNGRILKTKNASGTTQIDLSNYSSGVYLVKLYFNEGTETVKIVKE